VAEPTVLQTSSVLKVCLTRTISASFTCGKNKLIRILVCQHFMLDAINQGGYRHKSRADTEFIDSIFGRDRYLLSTEKLMQEIRAWNYQLSDECKEILCKRLQQRCRDNEGIARNWSTALRLPCYSLDNENSCVLRIALKMMATGYPDMTENYSSLQATAITGSFSNPNSTQLFIPPQGYR
jgi:hypothetical protein